MNLPQIITDTRERPWPHVWDKWIGKHCDLQLGWSHPALKKPACLPTGDFTTPDAFIYDDTLDKVLFSPLRLVERKTASDLYGCMTSERERFEEMLIRVLDLKLVFGTDTIVVIEASYASTFEFGTVEHDMNPKAFEETIKAWQRRFCPFVFCNSEQHAAWFALTWLTGQERIAETEEAK